MDICVYCWLVVVVTEVPLIEILLYVLHIGVLTAGLIWTHIPIDIPGLVFI